MPVARYSTCEVVGTDENTGSGSMRSDAGCPIVPVLSSGTHGHSRVAINAPKLNDTFAIFITPVLHAVLVSKIRFSR